MDSLWGVIVLCVAHSLSGIYMMVRCMCVCVCVCVCVKLYDFSEKYFYFGLAFSDGKSGSFPRTGSFGQFVSVNKFKKPVHRFF